MNGVSHILIDCPNHKPPSWSVWECTVRIIDGEVLYGGSCPSCGFKIWDKEILEATMLPLKYQRPSISEGFDSEKNVEL